MYETENNIALADIHTYKYTINYATITQHLCLQYLQYKHTHKQNTLAVVVRMHFSILIYERKLTKLNARFQMHIAMGRVEIHTFLMCAPMHAKHKIQIYRCLL